jgi:hypothetical protein
MSVGERRRVFSVAIAKLKSRNAIRSGFEVVYEQSEIKQV